MSDLLTRHVPETPIFVDEARTENFVSALAMPARKWGDEEDEPAPTPTVLVSSRDGAPVPDAPRAGWRTLEKACRGNGWKVKTTYAVAAVPAHTFKNGNHGKPAHELASVAVRFARGTSAGYAMWRNESGAGWRFDTAWLGTERFGWAAPKTLAGRPSILSVVTAAMVAP